MARRGDASKFLMFSIADVTSNPGSNAFNINVTKVSESSANPFGTTDPDNDIILSFSMVGTKGDKGDKGAQGEPGIGTKGAQGEDGPKGQQGEPGIGIKGAQGEDGPRTTRRRGSIRCY